jgi:hypothetical protein
VYVRVGVRAWVRYDQLKASELELDLDKPCLS